MSTSDNAAAPAASTTEITLLSGERYCVEGDARAVERTIFDAARGSIMQFAWLIEAETRDELAVNPQHVIALQAAGPRRVSD